MLNRQGMRESREQDSKENLKAQTKKTYAKYCELGDLDMYVVLEFS